MHDAIIEKITPYLKRTPTNECEVVYVLAEIRKLLERDDQQERFVDLNFFSTWALHAKLYRREAKSIIEEVNAAVSKRSGPSLTRNDIVAETLFRLITLEDFKRDIERFLCENTLPAVWTAQGWDSFVANYCLVIQDCPLEISNSDPAVNGVQKLNLSASDYCADEDPELALYFHWEVVYADGSSGKLTVNLWKNGRQGIGYGG